MKRLALMFAMLVMVFSCDRVPVTGRRQLELVPNSQMMALANTEYNQFLSSNKVVTNTDQAQMVNRVGRNIAGAVETFMKSNNMAKDIEGYKWEFNLVESNEVNAWAMPGGKTVVYTGILPVTQTEAGLATVLGHEIGHAIAKHGGERMSQALTAQLGGVALDVALRNKPQETRGLFNAAYGVGTNVGVLLPFSRLQESEADRIGLIFMAMAGYNPQEAITFWERMSQSGGNQPPEFLSTHPSNATRIASLKQHMPEAMKYYKPGGVSSVK